MERRSIPFPVTYSLFPVEYQFPMEYQFPIHTIPFLLYKKLIREKQLYGVNIERNKGFKISVSNKVSNIFRYK